VKQEFYLQRTSESIEATIKLHNITIKFGEPRKCIQTSNKKKKVPKKEIYQLSMMRFHMILLLIRHYLRKQENKLYDMQRIKYVKK